LASLDDVEVRAVRVARAEELRVRDDMAADAVLGPDREVLRSQHAERDRFLVRSLRLMGLEEVGRGPMTRLARDAEVGLAVDDGGVALRAELAVGILDPEPRGEGLRLLPLEDIEGLEVSVVMPRLRRRLVVVTVRAVRRADVLGGERGRRRQGGHE